MFIPLLISSWLLAMCNAAPVQLIYAQPLPGYHQPFVGVAPQGMFYYQGLPYMLQTRQTQGGLNNTQFNEILAIFQNGASQAQGTIEQFQMLGQMWGQQWGGLLGGGERLPASTMELKPIENLADLSVKEAAAEQQPAELKQQLFRIADYPQYYGNYAILPALYNPIVGVPQIQPVRARSLADPNPIKNDKFLAQVAPSGVDGEVPLIPVGLSDGGEQLRSAAAAAVDLEKTEIVAAPIELVPDSPVVADDKAVLQSRSQNDESSDLNAVQFDAAKQGIAAENIAQAAPQAAAIAGKGGMAEAAPVATAIVGKDGLALAQPVASAVAGEFGGSAAKTDHKDEPEASKDKVE